MDPEWWRPSCFAHRRSLWPCFNCDIVSNWQRSAKDKRTQWALVEIEIRTNWGFSITRAPIELVISKSNELWSYEDICKGYQKTFSSFFSALNTNCGQNRILFGDSCNRCIARIGILLGWICFILSKDNKMWPYEDIFKGYQKRFSSFLSALNTKLGQHRDTFQGSGLQNTFSNEFADSLLFSALFASETFEDDKRNSKGIILIDLKRW